MYSLQHSGSRWASPGGNIRGKSSVRRRRARPWQRPPGAPGALPAPEAAWARAWAHAAPPAGGARARERPRTRVRLPRAAPCFPGGRLFQEGPRASFSPGIACSPRLGCFQTVLVGEEVNVGCRSPFAAEGRGSARGGCVGNSRGQIPSPGAGAEKAQPTHRGGRDEPQGLARGGRPGITAAPCSPSSSPRAATSRPCGEQGSQRVLLSSPVREERKSIARRVGALGEGGSCRWLMEGTPTNPWKMYPMLVKNPPEGGAEATW